MKVGPLTIVPPKRLGYRTTPMEVLALSMPRTATTSMVVALQMLGHEHVYHGWTIFADLPGARLWTAFMKAKLTGIGTLPTKADFDSLLGQYSAIGGDVPAVVFAEELIAAYPDAKVVLVERDVDAWRASMEENVAGIFSSLNKAMAWLEPEMLGMAVEFFRTAYLCFFRGRDKGEVEHNLKREYLDYYERIKMGTPKERLLVFRVEEGWEPLCAFLGKKVPEGEFPRLNERGSIREAERSVQRESLKKIGRNLAVVGGVVAFGWWLVT